MARTGEDSPLPGGLVLAIFGPTASGKTAVAERVVELVPADVVSADSAALYRGLEILTAAPGPPTRLVGIVDLDHEVSVGEYQRLAHEEIDAILAAGRTPVVVGGTGLYFRAALAQLELPPARAPAARRRWELAYEREGPEAAHAALAELDPAAAARVHRNDRRRVVRALELAEAGASLLPDGDRLWSAETRHPTVVVGLSVPLPELDERIQRRAEAMLAAGVVDEVRTAARGPLSATAAKVLGLRELAELPEGDALQALVRQTRRLARYQRKWMRRIPGLVTVDAARPTDEVVDEILEVARAR